MTERTTAFVEGTIFWAKVIGQPRMNYEQTGREWSYDFQPDDTGFLKEHRLLDRLKEDAKGTIPGPYIRLKKPELDKDGNKNEPIRIYDSEKQPWDGRLLGNGTRVVAKLSIVDWGKGKKKSIYTQALMVTDLEEFQSDEFGGYTKSEAKSPAKKANSKGKAQEIDDLDDDVPF